jgi:hypothetical protein
MENHADMKSVDLNATSIWKFVSCGTLAQVNGLEKELVIPMVLSISVGF